MSLWTNGLLILKTERVYYEGKITFRTFKNAFVPTQEQTVFDSKISNIIFSKSALLKAVSSVKYKSA